MDVITKEVWIAEEEKKSKDWPLGCPTLKCWGNEEETAKKTDRK